MNVWHMQFLDVSVKVDVAERGGWRAEGEGKQNCGRGMWFHNPYYSIYNVNCQMISQGGNLIKYLKFSEVQSEREWRKRWRIRGRSRKMNGGPRGKEKGRWGSWCGLIERGLCKLLSAVRNLRMRSWSVENFPLIFFWFLFQGRVHG